MIWLAIAGAAIVTYLDRALPLAVTLRARPPEPLRRYLDALPVAIIAALVGPAVAIPSGSLTRGAEPVAALVVIAVVLWRRTLLVAVLAGVAAVALLRLL